MKFSNRVVFVVLMFLTIVGIGAYAYSQGLSLIVIGDTPDEKVTSLFVPLAAMLATVFTFLMVLNSRVLEGKVEAGSVADLFTMPEFYPAWVGIAIGAANIFGVRILMLSAETQSLIVSVATTFTAILLYSFANRAPRETLTVAQKVQRRE